MLDFLFGSFVIVSVLDVISTYHALKDGKAKEANPVMAFLFNKAGLMPSLLAMKAGAIAVVWYTMGEYSVYILPVIIAVYLRIIWNNVSIYRQHRS